jgi:hypothetical protein
VGSCRNFCIGMSDKRQTTENPGINDVENESKPHGCQDVQGVTKNLKNKDVVEKGKLPVKETKDNDEQNEDEDEEDDEFYVEDDGDDEDDDENENENEDEDGDGDDDEDVPGPSSGIKRKLQDIASKGDDADRFEILEGLSGDEVDPALIISGGRRSRRSGAQGPSSRPKYTAAAQLDSDEDEW